MSAVRSAANRLVRRYHEPLRKISFVLCRSEL